MTQVKIIIAMTHVCIHLLQSLLLVHFKQNRIKRYIWNMAVSFLNNSIKEGCFIMINPYAGTISK